MHHPPGRKFCQKACPDILSHFSVPNHKSPAGLLSNPTAPMIAAQAQAHGVPASGKRHQNILVSEQFAQLFYESPPFEERIVHQAVESHPAAPGEKITPPVLQFRIVYDSTAHPFQMRGHVLRRKHSYRVGPPAQFIAGKIRYAKAARADIDDFANDRNPVVSAENGENALLYTKPPASSSFCHFTKTIQVGRVSARKSP